MGVKEMLHSDLIQLNVDVNDEVELFHVVAEDLLAKGYVTKDYIQGIIEREKNYPTGLITPYLNIALPHSDVQYINKAFIYVVRLENPIQVRQMGDNQLMEVKDLFFLGIKEPSKQVGLLSTLMVLFQDEDFVTDYLTLTNTNDVYELLKTKL